MSILIALILLAFTGVMWLQHKKGTFDGRTGWFINLVTYGIRNYSNLSLTILLAVMIFAKLWFLAFAIVVMWLVYVAIRKSQSEKEKGVDL
ncbi:hypothetical protein D3C71_1851250 [compost metagenome]